MKSAKCFTGFDFKNTWVVDKNSPYPYPQLQSCMQVRTESIELLSEPDKTSYYTTDKLDLTGSELKINKCRLGIFISIDAKQQNEQQKTAIYQIARKPAL